MPRNGVHVDEESSGGWGEFAARLCAHPGCAGPADVLYAVRHGQSTTNAGLRPATVAEADDMAIGLTELGRRQATAVGRWLVTLEPDAAPDLVLCSPYLRAVQTWRLAARELRVAGRPLPCHDIDVRLYDRYRGDFSHLPATVVRERFPEEYTKEQADPLGYRPPGGESFRDVAQRLRGVVARIEGDRRHRRVLIVAHDAVVLFLRQLLEKLTDTEILAITAAGLVGNASVTQWERDARGYRLLAYDERAHLPR
ncbi:histidine phosphatase family protein [Nocardia sp. NPDC050710]|uniref:histidine phosphatase family protein n=1 Tax=Nocardia sp. NPDC050710 TaxID=3157220 RepID=UPI0033FBD8AC